MNLESIAKQYVNKNKKSIQNVALAMQSAGATKERQNQFWKQQRKEARDHLTAGMSPLQMIWLAYQIAQWVRWIIRELKRQSELTG